MNGFSEYVPALPHPRLKLAVLLCLHIVVSFLSLVYVTQTYSYLQMIFFDSGRLYASVLTGAPLVIFSLFFVFGQFSFGYILGFYFYTMILSYLWLVPFSRFPYDHTVPAISAFISALAFLIPALLVTSPIKQRFTLSLRALDKLLSLILLSAATIVAIGALYNFRLTNLVDIYKFRDGLEFPALLRYSIGAMSYALLPFAFACFVARGNRWRALTVLLLLLLLYPITLSKITLFAPVWLLFIVLLSGFFEARAVVILTLLLPLSIGIIMALLCIGGVLSHDQIKEYFGVVNFRMIAVPSLALDIYNDFFSTHDLTHFCQIFILKSFLHCAYSEPLSVLMEKTYHLGNLNASLFATEGIASVGPVFAPFAVVVCGLIISFGNRLSSGLPSRFILLSGGILAQAFLNIPLTTNLLTNGAGMLFLLWYVTPRAMFEAGD